MVVEATKEEYEKNILVLAALETIRVNQFHIFNLQVVKHEGNDTNSQFLYTPKFETGYVYIITSITIMSTEDTAFTGLVGVKDGATHFYYEGATTTVAYNTINYVGQLMCKEGDQIFGEFRGIGASDTIYLFINGYKIRR